jgi:PDZ domain
VRLSAIALMAAVCVAGPLRAQDFQIGGDEQRETSIPLEVYSSLGLFISGYINGRGPYRFGISLAGHTELTPAVVMDAGLATRDRGARLDGNVNRYEQDLQLMDATLRLGDKEISLNGANVLPPDDPAAYLPVPNYGGVIGVELFRKGIVSMDLIHHRLVLSPHKDIVQAPDAIELSMQQSARGADLDRLPAVSLSLDGQPGKFRVAFTSGAVSFRQDSQLGQDLLDKAPHRYTTRQWTPGGLVRYEGGASVPFAFGDQPGAGSVSVSRRLDAPPMPIRASPRALAAPSRSPFDGTIGLRVLSGFDIAIDDQAGTMWLTPRDRNLSRCRGFPRGNLHGTTGFIPWLYKGQGIVNSVTDGSPADAAGIEPGDQIVSIDDGDVFAYYDRLEATCLVPAIVKLVFRNASGDHTVTLTPAVW